MCGRYALGAGDNEIFGAIDAQYPTLYRRLRRRGGGGGRDDDDDGDGDGDGGGSGDGDGDGAGAGGRVRGRAAGGDAPQRLRGGDIRWDRQHDFRPSFNIAPKQRAPIIRADGGDAVVETMQWGLIPHWTKHPPTGPLNTINARSEGLIDPSSGGMWHALKGHKRCVVPAQGYYEWHKRPSAKVAHFTRLPLSASPSSSASPAHPPLIFFAGLYDTVKYATPVESRFVARAGDDREPYPTGNPVPLSTFTILTTTPAGDIAWLHDRMPCVLRTEDEVLRWLGLEGEAGWVDGKRGTGTLLKSTSGLDCYPVPPEVGKIGQDSPSYILPVSERSDGIKSFFQKQSPAKPKASAVKRESEDVKREPSVKREVDAKRGGSVDKGEWAAEAKGEEATSRDSVKREDVKTEDGLVGAIDEEREAGIGDDSNAPNLEVEGKPDAPDTGGAPDTGDALDSDVELVDDGGAERGGKSEPGKRKREADDAETADKKRETPRRGGHQTKVVRKVDTAPKEQPAITSFFKPPGAATRSTRRK